MSDFRVKSTLHELECPHCQQRTQHSSPGATIPFAKAKCQHCGQEFLIVQSKPWLGDNGNGQRS